MTASRINGSLYTNIQKNIAIIKLGDPAGNFFPSELLDRLTKFSK